MGKRKKKKKTFYLVLRGQTPGVYGSRKEALAEVMVVEGGHWTQIRCRNRREALAIFDGLKRQGRVETLPPLTGFRSRAYVDGSAKDGIGAAGAALLLSPWGEAQAAFRRFHPGWGAKEAEEIAVLLALALAAPGEKLVVHTDVDGLAEMWAGTAPPSPRIRAAKKVAEALEVEVVVVPVARGKNPAHTPAQRAMAGVFLTDGEDEGKSP